MPTLSPTLTSLPPFQALLSSTTDQEMLKALGDADAVILLAELQTGAEKYDVDKLLTAMGYSP